MHALKVCDQNEETLPMFPELPEVRVPSKSIDTANAAQTLACGVVQWFNPLLGHGEVLLHDGRTATLELTSLARLFMHGIAKDAEVFGELDEQTGEMPRLCKISCINWSNVTELALVSTKSVEVTPKAYSGRVKQYNTQRGFGFIIPDKHIGSDVFIHVKKLRECGIHTDLFEGQRVTFTFEKSERGGWSASTIQLA